MSIKNINLISIIFFILFLFIFQISAIKALSANIEVNEADWYKLSKASGYNSIGITNFYAPLPVFFEAWKSSPREEITFYSWNFGDGKSDSGPGMFNAAHVYETPGSYTATVTVRDVNGNTASASIPITVLARDGTTYYVDSAIGDDNYDGKCQTVSGSCGPWKTANKAMRGVGGKSCVTNPVSNCGLDSSCPIVNSIYKPGDQILFKRGQTFYFTNMTSCTNTLGVISQNDFTSQIRYNYGSGFGYGYLIGAYGSGPSPVLINQAGFSGKFIDTFHSAVLITVKDLSFSSNQKCSGMVFNNQNSNFQNVLFYNINVTSFNSAFQTASIDYGSGVFIFNSYMYNLTKDNLYYKGSRLVIINTTFSLTDSHQNYLSYVDKGIIMDNLYEKSASGFNGFRLSAATDYTDFSHPTNNVYLARNKFIGWIDPQFTTGCVCGGTCPGKGQHLGENRYSLLMVQIGPNEGGKNQTIENIVFENNLVTNGEQMLEITDSENITVRNNIFVSNNSVTKSAKIIFGNPIQSKPSKNVYIVGNTFINRNDQWSGNINQRYGIIHISSYNGPNPYPYYDYTINQNIVIKNNIFYILGQTAGARFLRFGNNSNQDVIKNITSDYNLFYINGGASNGGYFHFATNGTYRFMNITEWPSIMGKDQHSIFLQDPLFITPITDALLSQEIFNGDLHLNPSSPAINTGENIPKLASYDKDNILRSLYSPSDIGAYEYGELIIPSETCSDGIQNQDEEGVDCGGTCPSCSIEEPENTDNITTEWGPLQNLNPPVKLTNKDLTILGIILNNSNNGICANCQLSVNFEGITNITITNSEGKFEARFNGIDFYTGVHDISIDVTSPYTKHYTKEIYILN